MSEEELASAHVELKVILDAVTAARLAVELAHEVAADADVDDKLELARTQLVDAQRRLTALVHAG
jgi:hypothetical protein